MKKKALAELKTKTIEELLKQASEKKQELSMLLIDKNLAKLKNTASLKILKKDIARMATFIREKEVASK